MVTMRRPKPVSFASNTAPQRPQDHTARQAHTRRTKEMHKNGGPRRRSVTLFKVAWARTPTQRQRHTIKVQEQ